MQPPPTRAADSIGGSPDDTRVVLAAHLNFRDLGGYPTADGRVVRRRAVYRSAHLHELEEPDHSTLRGLGIRTVCDLRNEEEAAARPGPFTGQDGIEVHSIGMLGSRATGDPVKTILEYGITRITPDDLARVYRMFLEQHARGFGRVVELCADPSGHALVVHCSAGKDRTGLAAALVLSVLGVPDELVIADYELTSELWSPPQLERAERLLAEAGVDAAPLRHYFLAPAEAMEVTLDYLRAEHGSVEGYLVDAAGVAPDTLAALRDCLLGDG